MYKNTEQATTMGGYAACLSIGGRRWWDNTVTLTYFRVYKHPQGDSACLEVEFGQKG